MNIVRKLEEAFREAAGIREGYVPALGPATSQTGSLYVRLVCLTGELTGQHQGESPLRRRAHTRPPSIASYRARAGSSMRTVWICVATSIPVSPGSLAPETSKWPK